VLDSCLFEPGAWSPSALNEAPTLIPDLSRATLSTPCGLLFNELVQSPKELMGHVRRILDLATDMDTGSFYGPSSPVILYVVRMVTRVCHYAGFVLRNFEWHKQRLAARGGDGCGAPGAGAGAGAGAGGGSGYQANVRGLCPDPRRGHLVAELGAITNAVQHKMTSKVWPMLESWRLKLLRAAPPAVSDACVVFTHQSYMYYEAEHLSRHDALDAQRRLANQCSLEKALSVKAVETLVTSHIFLSHNYTFDMEAPLEAAAADAAADDAQAAQARHASKATRNKAAKRGRAGGHAAVDTLLEVPQMEVFMLYARHRNAILRWLKGGGSQEAGGFGDQDGVKCTSHELLERVILSLTGPRSMGRSWRADKDGCARVWDSLDYPVSACLTLRAGAPPSAHRVACMGPSTHVLDYRISPHWRSPHPASFHVPRHQTPFPQGCEGRFCPDTERKSFAATVAKAPDMAAAAAAGAGGGKSVFQEWLRITTTAAVETELNLQMGTFTLKSNQVLSLLDLSSLMLLLDPSSLMPP
jgi:hypothetical protein